MPSINQMKKEIIHLQQEINKPVDADNWKRHNPRWKYDLMFCDWLLYHDFNKHDIDSVDDYGRPYRDYRISERGRPFNQEDLNEALKYFKENEINPIDELIDNGTSHLDCFIMFVDTESYFNNTVSDSMIEDWNNFIKTGDFNIMVKRFDNYADG